MIGDRGEGILVLPALRGGGGGVSAAEVFGCGSEGQGNGLPSGFRGDWAELVDVGVGLLGGESCSKASCCRAGDPAGLRSYKSQG